MSSWNSHRLREEEALDIDCLPHMMQFRNPSPRNLTTVHTLSHVLPSTHMMTRGNKSTRNGGLIWVTQIWGGVLYPLPTTLHVKESFTRLNNRDSIQEI